MTNVLVVNKKEEFRNWLINNSDKEKECWVNVSKAKPNGTIFNYIDAVYEALCFGWIDSVQCKKDGMLFQKFSPRKKNSNWTELNKERARYLIKKGLMTEKGFKVLPSLTKKFKIDKEIEECLKKARCFKIFKSFPPLYQRIRISNILSYKKDKIIYEKGLKHLIEETKKGRMFGFWNDYGKLINY